MFTPRVCVCVCVCTLRVCACVCVHTHWRSRAAASLPRAMLLMVTFCILVDFHPHMKPLHCDFLRVKFSEARLVCDARVPLPGGAVARVSMNCLTTRGTFTAWNVEMPHGAADVHQVARHVCFALLPPVLLPHVQAHVGQLHLY